MNKLIRALASNELQIALLIVDYAAIIYLLITR